MQAWYEFAGANRPKEWGFGTLEEVQAYCLRLNREKSVDFAYHQEVKNPDKLKSLESLGGGGFSLRQS